MEHMKKAPSYAHGKDGLAQVPKVHSGQKGGSL